VIGITYDRLIKIADLHMNLPFRVRDRTQISDMTIATDPNWRAIGNGSPASPSQPKIKLVRASAHKSMGRRRHFGVPMFGQQLLSTL
jgi:hypothetical protein